MAETSPNAQTVRHKNPHRPYANKRKWGPSITSVIGSMAKDGLQWGAARETAIYAVKHANEWMTMGMNEAVEKLRVHFDVLWSGQAAMGTLIHSINEAWTYGEGVEVREEVDKIIADKRPPKIWMGREDEVVEQAQPFIDGLEKFWRDNNPQTIQSEEVVYYPHPELAYIGTRDWIVNIDGRIGNVEVKTTAQQDYEKGLYFDSWRVQLAAQRHATRRLFFDADGKLIGEEDNYPVDFCGVLHLRGDGGYQFFEVQADKDEWEVFLTLRRLHDWRTKGHKTPAPKVLSSAHPSSYIDDPFEGIAS